IFTFLGALTFLAIIGLALRGSLPDLERSRLRVIFVGGLLGFLIPTVSTVLTSSFQIPIPYNIALVPTVFFPLSVAYALLKYSLFDLGNALKIALSRIALTAFLLAMYAVVVFLVPPWVGTAKDPFVPLFFSVLVVVVFNPLLRWIEAVVDRYVYRQDYEPAQVQEEVSLFLRSLAAPPALAQGFTERVGHGIGIEAVTLAYRPKKAEAFLTVSPDGVPQNRMSIDEGIGLLSEHIGSVSYHGLARGEVTTNPSFRERCDETLDFFDRWKAELLMPLVFEREVRGFVSFRAKRSHRGHSAKAAILLPTIGDQSLG